MRSSALFSASSSVTLIKRGEGTLAFAKHERMRNLSLALRAASKECPGSPIFSVIYDTEAEKSVPAVKTPASLPSVLSSSRAKESKASLSFKSTGLKISASGTHTAFGFPSAMATLYPSFDAA